MQSNQMVWASIYIHFQARLEKNSAAVLFQVSLKYYSFSKYLVNNTFIIVAFLVTLLKCLYKIIIIFILFNILPTNCLSFF